MHDVFLSYSRNDSQAGATLRLQLTKHGLSIFKDDESIREGELWLNRLQEEVDASGAFVVLVGQDGVQRWIGAETQIALGRYFGPHEDAQRLPIFPILLGDIRPEGLPAFLSLFQATPWNGIDPLPQRLVDQIRERKLVPTEVAFKGCPFVGLAAYGIDQSQLFYGRQKETLDALACFDSQPTSPTVRWLEVNGNSGSGKSSLMNAGLLPLVDQGWLWPRTGYVRWRRIGPMMPGEHAVAMLAEHLARTFRVEMADVHARLKGDDRALSDWLRSRKEDGTAFLLAIDQFEELFTFSDPEERGRFDRLLAGALDDPDCPLFVMSTVRADFLDRFELLPRLVAVRNHVGRSWTLPPIGDDGLREIIDGSARLAGLDVSEVKEAIVAEARDEPGALPLVENALLRLWEERTGNRLSGRLFSNQGGLAGILSRSADGLLAALDKQQQGHALELLFRMVQVDPDSRRHTRRRIPLAEAIDIAGGGERGRIVVDRLAGQRPRDGRTVEGPLRLVTVTEEANKDPSSKRTRWVNLIHETLIHSRGTDAKGKPQPYWPAFWNYIEKNKQRAARRERLQLQAREWQDRKGLARLLGLAGLSALFGFRGLASPGSIEQRYLRWSRACALVEAIMLAATVGLLATLVNRANELSTLADERLAVGLRVVDRITTLDFANWRSISMEDYKTRSETARSLVVSHNWFKIKRTRKEPSFFIHIYSTRSNVDPIFSCKPVDCKSKASGISGSGLREFVLGFNLSDLKVGDTKEISFDVTFVNAFHCETEIGGIRMLHDTEVAKFGVLFPSSNRPRAVDLERIFLENDQEGPLEKADPYYTISEAPDGTVNSLSWTLVRPITDRIYIVRWKWAARDDWRIQKPCPPRE